MEKEMDMVSPSRAPASATSDFWQRYGRNLKLVPLSQAIDDQYTGIPFEPLEKRTKLMDDADHYVSFKNPRTSTSERESLLHACKKGKSQGDIFCKLIRMAAVNEGSRLRHRSRHVSKALANQLAKEMKRARIAALRGANEKDLTHALKKFDDLTPLGPLLHKIVETKQCASAPLYDTLGRKTEEFFPDPEKVDLAISLYRRAMDCGESESAAKAAFRLSLIYIWQRNWDQAETILSQLTDSPDGADYREKIVFWRYVCAKMKRNMPLTRQMVTLLAQEYPLGFDTLLTEGSRDYVSALAVDGPELYVSLRSQAMPGLNEWVEAAEALQALGAQRLSMRVLDHMIGPMAQAEPPFQLYVTVLLYRAGDTNHEFRVLSRLFREFPVLVSRRTLEMMYPLRDFNIIQQFAGEEDPYLILSLIRQESAFNEDAKSPAGAIGLMQLMPKTARRFERIRRRELLDPWVNVRVGIRYFASLLERYQGRAEYALAAYNAGEDKVDDWQTRYPVGNSALFVDLIPFQETRGYVSAIARNYYWYLRLYAPEKLLPLLQNGGRIPASIGVKTPFASLFHS